VLSIDIMRGATIALMILVNDPGDWQEVYAPLRHAEWNGYTAADLVFPNFLFVAGASLVFSLQSRIERGDSKLELARGLGRRSFNLLLLKLFIAGLPTFRLRRIRIFGVLFRTALCSLAAGLILLVTLSTSVVLAIASSLLGGYYLLLRLPIAGLNRPLLDADNNIAAWLDRKVAHLFHGELHTGALYNVTHDPEGLLSSLPAVSTVLLGACAALTMRSAQLSPGRKAVTVRLHWWRVTRVIATFRLTRIFGQAPMRWLRRGGRCWLCLRFIGCMT
jgi:predicted acyltransferase